MSRTRLPAAIAMLGAGFAATWFWQHREREPAMPLQEQAAAVAAPQAVPVVDPLAIAAPEQTGSAASRPEAVDPETYDIQMRKRNPNYIGVVKGKSGAMQLAYPDLARELNITPEQAEALYDLLAKQEAKQGDLLQRARSEFDAAIKGHEREWQEYQPTLDARRRVSELTNMVETTSPLSETQAKQLVAFVVKEQRMRADEQAARGPPANNPLAQLEFAEQNQASRELSNRRTVDAMRSYLTEPQLVIMENAMAGLNRQIRANLQAQRAQLESGNAPQSVQPSR